MLTVGLFMSTWAQAAEMTSGKAVYHDTSPPLSEMVNSAAPATGGPNREIAIGVKPDLGRFPDLAAPDGGLQSPSWSISPMGPTPGFIISEPGLSEQDNVDTVGVAIVPPDVNGDIGLDDFGNRIYIQYINLIWGVFDVTGNLTDGPFAGNTFWAGFGDFCQDNNDGDPIVLYDDEAGRWMFSQFSINQGIQCVAVSTTSDPLGPYHRYAFVVTPGGANDYPKMGVWHDSTADADGGQSAYTLTLRDFGGAGGAFSVSAGVMERNKMLDGDPAQFVKFTNPCTADCIEGQLPPHQAGPTPPANTCPTYWTAVDSAFDDSPHTNDGYRNHTLCVDWTTIGNSTYSEGPLVVAGSNFDRFLAGNTVRPVLGGEALDALQFFTMNRAQYRWFGDNARVVFNTTVDAGGDRAGIRWAETRSADGDSGWTLQQDGTYAPDDGLERWMGSIAQDQAGNIALGFSAAGKDLFPAVRYTSRMGGDPDGTMPGGEVSCVEGGGAQVASANRWGDYSSMSVDPTDDCTFWYTQEYYQTTDSFNWNTRICSFRFPDCGEPPTGCTIDSECDNGAFCDGPETCNTGTGECVAGPPPVCDDGVSCTDDSCNAGTDACDNVANNANCADPAFCNGDETCDAVNDCQAGSSPCADDAICNESIDICQAPATEMHVGSIVTGTQAGSRGRKFGKATVTILDNNDNPVGVDFTVTGDFSGSFTETGASANTESSGVVVILTSNSKKKVGAPAFCVSSVSGGSLIYISDENADGTTCDAAAVCGNNTIEVGEICDDSDLDGETCVSQGFDGGTLTCQGDCEGFNTSACTGTPPPPACVPTHSKEKGPRCSDGIDNDCDGDIDGADSDC